MSDDDDRKGPDLERAAEGFDLLGGVLSGGLAGGLSNLVERLRDRARELEREGSIERSGELGSGKDGLRGRFNVRVSTGLGDRKSSVPSREPSARASHHVPKPAKRPPRSSSREVVVGSSRAPTVEVFEEGGGRARVLVEMPGLTPDRVSCELDGDILVVNVRGEESTHELEILLPAPATRHALSPGDGIVTITLEP